jgi:GntR family transcriptional repressor for pyruvate dehydrogenase complex
MAELIADDLRGQIVRHELADGDYLPVEADLCAHFETSRPTMREAFRILEAEGLLSIRRGGRFGPQVRAPHVSVTARSLGLLLQHQNVDLGAVYDAYLDLVPPGARRLALARTDDDLGRLRAQRERCVAATTSAAFLEESTAFSLLVVELAGNPVQLVLCQLLAEVLRGHRAAMSAFFDAKPRAQAKRTAEVLESTATVIAMIEAGDEGVEAYLHRSLDSHMRQAIQVPLGEAVQLV